MNVRSTGKCMPQLILGQLKPDQHWPRAITCLRSGGLVSQQCSRGMPTLGQGHSEQEFAEEHKDDHAEAFTASIDAKQVGQCFAVHNCATGKPVWCLLYCAAAFDLLQACLVALAETLDSKYCIVWLPWQMACCQVSPV